MVFGSMLELRFSFLKVADDAVKLISTDLTPCNRHAIFLIGPLLLVQTGSALIRVLGKSWLSIEALRESIRESGFKQQETRNRTICLSFGLGIRSKARLAHSVL